MSSDPSLRLAVTEIYASIQGESTHAGRPCAFVRLAGCPLRCTWCDTEYSFAAGERRSIDDICQQVNNLGVALVEVTGGEPLAQKPTPELLRALCEGGFEVLIETSGAYPWRHLDPRVKIIADLKCPGSAESHRNLLPELAQLRPQDELKIVVASRGDFDWALQVLRGELAGVAATVLWSAVWQNVALADLAAWLLAERAPGRMQVQLHKVIWPDLDRGV
ncbi:MAG: radical SAM protein [Deltaproteobacteria bacterium]|nr:radical SAM protein [Deltaproteobacteria bacterium]